MNGKVYTIPEWAKYSDERRVAWIRQQLIEEYAPDPRWASLVSRILRDRGVQPRDWPAIAAALRKWVAETIYYVNEKGERIQSPWRTLELGCGDCDDCAILLATLASSIDMPNRLVLAGRRKSGQLVRWIEGQGKPPAGVEWFHIYVMLGWPPGKPKHWASAEATMASAPLGYDLVKHGIVVDNHGRPRIPRPGELSRGPQQGQGFYGDLGTAAEDTELLGERKGFLKRLFSREFVQNAILSAIEASIGAVFIYYVTRAVERRERRNGRGSRSATRAAREYTNGRRRGGRR